jgi:multimeric flavodoxin WrbA
VLPDAVQSFINAQADASPLRFDGLRAVFLNGTLKRSPETSHTDGLLSVSRALMERLGVRTDVLRLVDHTIPPGVQPDMREHGWPADDFPDLYRQFIEPAHIVVLASPIWLGDQSSMTRLAIERLYGWSGQTNAAGQWSYYGKVGGAIITGNEDGGKHCAAQMLYALSHIGFVIPPHVLDRRGRTGPVLPGRQPGRPQPLDDPQHGLRSLEHAPPRPDDHRGGRDPCVRQRHPRLEPVRPRAPQPGVPLTDGQPASRRPPIATARSA